MPRISAATVAEHRQLLRARVFAAFAELVGERGYERVTMADVAAAAEVGRTALYHHFHDKEAVAIAFATAETSRYLAALEDVLAREATASGRLRAYVRHQIEAGATFHMGFGALLYGALSPAGQVAIREHVHEVERVLRDLLEAGRERGEFALGRPEEVDAAVVLVQACLSPRHVPAAQTELFVLRAVGAAGPGVSDA